MQQKIHQLTKEIESTHKKIVESKHQSEQASKDYDAIALQQSARNEPKNIHNDASIPLAQHIRFFNNQVGRREKRLINFMNEKRQLTVQYEALAKEIASQSTVKRSPSPA